MIADLFPFGWGDTWVFFLKPFLHGALLCVVLVVSLVVTLFRDRK